MSIFSKKIAQSAWSLTTLKMRLLFSLVTDAIISIPSVLSNGYQSTIDVLFAINFSQFIVQVEQN